MALANSGIHQSPSRVVNPKVARVSFWVEGEGVFRPQSSKTGAHPSQHSNELTMQGGFSFDFRVSDTMEATSVLGISSNAPKNSNLPRIPRAPFFPRAPP